MPSRCLNQQDLRVFRIFIKYLVLTVRVNEITSAIVECEFFEQNFYQIGELKIIYATITYRMQHNTIVQEPGKGGHTNPMVQEQFSSIIGVLKYLQVVHSSEKSDFEGSADHVIRVRSKEMVSQLISWWDHQCE